MNPPVLVPVPPGVVTTTSTAPATCAGLVTVILVAETTTTLVPAVPPKVTPVAPLKFVPVNVTDVPPADRPVDGATAVTVGTETPIVYAFDAVPTLFFAVIVNVKEPAVVGVPEITPVAEANERPAGREPDDTANVIVSSPVAVTVAEYAEPTLPDGNDAVVIDGPTSTDTELELLLAT